MVCSHLLAPLGPSAKDRGTLERHPKSTQVGLLEVIGFLFDAETRCKGRCRTPHTSAHIRHQGQARVIRWQTTQRQPPSYEPRALMRLAPFEPMWRNQTPKSCAGRRQSGRQQAAKASSKLGRETPTGIFPANLVAQCSPSTSADKYPANPKQRPCWHGLRRLRYDRTFDSTEGQGQATPVLLRGGRDSRQQALLSDHAAMCAALRSAQRLRSGVGCTTPWI